MHFTYPFKYRYYICALAFVSVVFQCNRDTKGYCLFTPSVHLSEQWYFFLQWQVWLLQIMLCLFVPSRTLMTTSASRGSGQQNIQRQQRKHPRWKNNIHVVLSFCWLFIRDSFLICLPMLCRNYQRNYNDRKTNERNKGPTPL